jgi:hypothetical protein
MIVEGTGRDRYSTKLMTAVTDEHFKDITEQARTNLKADSRTNKNWTKRIEAFAANIRAT